MPLVAPILALLLAILLALWPVQWAARAVGARRSSLFWCGLALLGASLLHGLGLLAPVAGSLAAFLLSAAGFAAILGTDYLRGIGIAVRTTCAASASPYCIRYSACSCWSCWRSFLAPARWDGACSKQHPFALLPSAIKFPGARWRCRIPSVAGTCRSG